MLTREQFYIVYRHTAPSEKVYIGITCQKPEKRWRYGCGYKHNSYFTAAIKKYGWNNIKHEILFTGLTKAEAEQKEIELIAFYHSNDRTYGYNQSTGGEHGATGYKFTEEQRKALSNKMRGRPTSEEQKERLRKLRKGVKNTAETRIKMSETRKGMKHSEEWTNKIASANRGKKRSEEFRKRCCKKVLQMDSNGNVIHLFDSASEAAQAIGCSVNSISCAALGKREKAFGYRWEYVC